MVYAGTWAQVAGNHPTPLTVLLPQALPHTLTPASCAKEMCARGPEVVRPYHQEPLRCSCP